ncbi:type IV secretion system protein [Candidatus Vondammii sp. HM_W22]|uniref:type IV secretion system protein n=1 Tax=Candidatus Vondammii sp. HM_W22 TaxID=2687299 RepID=UPI002E7BABDB|nr:type IV secretion system protein [Candidatus Vondammii sp. HM_W22]
MKKNIVAAFAMVTSTAQASGIPVVDIANLTQSITQVTHMVEQISKLQAQLEKAQQLLDSINGARGYGSFAPISYDTALSTNPENTLKSYGINTASHWGLDGKTAKIYNADNKNAAIYLERSQTALTQSKGRFSTINGLVRAIDGAEDQKDIMDLQARIAGERADKTRCAQGGSSRRGKKCSGEKTYSGACISLGRPHY